LVPQKTAARIKEVSISSAALSLPPAKTPDSTAQHWLRTRPQDLQDHVVIPSGVKSLLVRRRELFPLGVIGLSKQNLEPTSGLEPLSPALVTSDNSCVARVCTGLEMPHKWAAFSAPGCCVLHRIAPYCVPGGIKIAFPVVFAGSASAEPKVVSPQDGWCPPDAISLRLGMRGRGC
jgi:hypothetical protein